MILDFKQICSVSQGAVRADKTEDGVRLYRFTEEQAEIYRQTNADFYMKTFASSGMKLCFETDSRTLFLKVNITEGSSRKYFSFDVMVNGKPVGYLDNFSKTALPQDYTKIQLPLGEFSKEFSLGEGSKEVRIYLPWSVAVEIKEVSLDEGAFVKPVRPEKKMLVFGDSITQGYDALRPSNRYGARLAEALHAEEINKGIGGEMFFPALAKAYDDFEPDYIVVSYGSNDWRKTDGTHFHDNCRSFYAALSEHYPNARIFALSPIWRKDCVDVRPFGPFAKATEYIENIVKEFKNITFIRGLDFVPKNANYFADLRLHPNDMGFDYFFDSLCRQIADNCDDLREEISLCQK